MPDPQRLAHVDHDEDDAHGYGSDRQQFSEEHDLLDRFEVIQICRNDKQDCGSSNADKKGEVRDIESPGYLIPHAGYDEAPVHLADIGAHTDEYQKGEK